MGGHWEGRHRKHGVGGGHGETLGTRGWEGHRGDTGHEGLGGHRGTLGTRGWKGHMLGNTGTLGMWCWGTHRGTLGTWVFEDGVGRGGGVGVTLGGCHPGWG